MPPPAPTPSPTLPCTLRSPVLSAEIGRRLLASGDSSSAAAASSPDPDHSKLIPSFPPSKQLKISIPKPWPPPTMPPPPPPALPDELLEEIFLRLPPDEPACLVRASLASKLWLGLLTGPRFRGLYRERHGAPPMLGFIYSCPPDHVPEEEEDNNLPRFVATSKFGVRVPAVEDWRGWHKDYAAWDCRHGRVLFSNNDVIPMPLVVWDPMTGRRRLMYAPEDYDSSGAAVLCNVTTGCDHRACHGGPFQVVFVGLYNGDGGCVAYAHVSLPDVGKWSKPCPALDLAMEDAFIVDRPPVFIQDALYFMLTYEYHDDDGNDNIAILKYDLGSNCLSFIDAPPVKTGLAGDVVLMAMEDASLGFAHVDRLTLKLWSRQMGSNGVATWTQRRVVNLEELLLIQNLKQTLRLIGSVEAGDIIFVATDLGNYEINVKSLQWKELWQRKKYRALFPYMSFYNPPERVSLSDAEH